MKTSCKFDIDTISVELDETLLNLFAGTSSGLIVFTARKAQQSAEKKNLDVHRAAYDGVQEHLDTVQELRSRGLEQAYLDGVDQKLEYVVKCAFQNEIVPGVA